MSKVQITQLQKDGGGHICKTHNVVYYGTCSLCFYAQEKRRTQNAFERKLKQAREKFNHEPFVFHCASCCCMVKTRCAEAEDAETKKPYTDLICTKCDYIITTFEKASENV